MITDTIPTPNCTTKFDAMMIDYIPSVINTDDDPAAAENNNISSMLLEQNTWKVVAAVDGKTPAGISDKLMYDLESSVFAMLRATKSLVPFEDCSQVILGVSASDPRLEETTLSTKAEMQELKTHSKTFQSRLSDLESHLFVTKGWQIITMVACLIQTYQITRRAAQRTRRAKNPKLLKKLRFLRNQTGSMLDDLFESIHQNAGAYLFPINTTGAGGFELRKAFPQLDIQSACDNLRYNTDVVFVRHLIEVNNVPLFNFRKALRLAMIMGEMNLVILLVRRKDGMSMIRQDQGPLVLDIDIKCARNAIMASLNRGDLGTFELLLDCYPENLWNDSIVNMEMVGRSKNPDMIRILCGPKFKFALTPPGADGFLCTHEWKGWIHLWNTMPSHMHRLFGSSTSRLAYHWPLAILEADLDTLKHLYKDGVLEFSDKNLTNDLIRSGRTDIFMWLDQKVLHHIKTKKEHYAVQTEQIREPALKRRRLSATRSVSTKRIRKNITCVTLYDGSENTPKRSRGKPSEVRELLTHNFFTFKPEKEISRRLHLLYRKYLKDDVEHSKELDEDEEVAHIEEDWYRKMWVFAWVCSRNHWIGECKILLLFMEQIEFPETVAEKIEYPFESVIDELVETFKSQLEPMSKTNAFVVSLKRHARNLWPSV